MNFEIYLRYSENLIIAEKDPLYSPEEHAVVGKMCDTIEKTNWQNIDFSISLQDKNEKPAHFPCNISYDLYTFLEQLPGAMKKISDNDYNFRIDFYEQGSNCYLKFRSTKDKMVNVAFNYYSGDIACCAIVLESELKSMFEEIYHGFVFLSKTICGYLYKFDDYSIRSLLSMENYFK